MLHPQNGDRIVVIDSVTSLYPVWSGDVYLSSTDLWCDIAPAGEVFSRICRWNTIPVYLFPKSTNRLFSSRILVREGYSDGASIMKTLSWYVWPFWKTRVTDRCSDRRTDIHVRCTHVCMCSCVKYHTATSEKIDVRSQANHNWLFFYCLHILAYTPFYGANLPSKCDCNFDILCDFL